MAKSHRGPSAETNRRNQARIRAQQEAAAAARRRRMLQLSIVGGVALLVVAIVASAVIIGQRGQSSSATPSVDTTVTVNNVSVPFAIDGSAVRVGAADAKAKVDLWVDYSCPHCQEFEAANSDVLNQLVSAGDVSVSYHNIQIVTAYGTAAGSAAACVASLDPTKWVAFNSSLYANHSADTDGWRAADFRSFAAQQGVNDNALSCIAEGRYTGWIAANTAASDKAGVDGTPTMFLNGEKSETLSGAALTAKVNQLAGR